MNDFYCKLINSLMNRVIADNETTDIILTRGLREQLVKRQHGVIVSVIVNVIVLMIVIVIGFDDDHFLLTVTVID